MSSEELNKEYSPSYWSKRFKTGEEVLQNHFKIVEEGEHFHTKKLEAEFNVKYLNCRNATKSKKIQLQKEYSIWRPRNGANGYIFQYRARYSPILSANI